MVVKLAQERAKNQHGDYDSLLIAHKDKLLFESYYLDGRINLTHQPDASTSASDEILHWLGAWPRNQTGLVQEESLLIIKYGNIIDLLDHEQEHIVPLRELTCKYTRFLMGFDDPFFENVLLL